MSRGQDFEASPAVEVAFQLPESVRKRPWVVLGNEGFLGQYLVKELMRQGCEVHGIDCLPQGPLPLSGFAQLDLTHPLQIQSYTFPKNAVVVHLAARIFTEATPPRLERERYFTKNNFDGTLHLLKTMKDQGLRDLLYFTTDMVYGTPLYNPVDESHPRRPNGPYGRSKMLSEDLCDVYRQQHGFRISIFRPRMILGPGRLGILKKLFGLIRHNLPVPMVGDGSNCYQMVSVYDCVQATLRAAAKDFPNSVYNMGSDNPPTVRELLSTVIEHANSRSFLVPTPVRPIQRLLQGLDLAGLTLMYPEQFLIANEQYVLDLQRPKEELGWSPQFGDLDMMRQAYAEYLQLSPQ